MICIFCLEEQAPSVEHVFPLAVGGRLKTERVCERCNSTLGSRVDSALCDFLPIRHRRAELRLAGNTGRPPGLFELLTGEAKLVGEDGGRVRTAFDEATGSLVQTRLYSARETTTPDGQKIRQITIDAKDRDQIPTIIQRERKRYGLRPLSDSELAVAASNCTVSTVAPVVIQKNISVSFAYLRHAMFKIAYELAFLWLGDSFLDDPLAAELRTAICSEDVHSTDNLYGWVDFAPGCAAFDAFWIPHHAHHLAYSNVFANQYVVAVRVFDIYAAVIPVSRDLKHSDPEKRRFLVQDAASGKMVDTTFAEEQQRLTLRMTELQRFPPFQDPL